MTSANPKLLLQWTTFLLLIIFFSSLSSRRVSSTPIPRRAMGSTNSTAINTEFLRAHNSVRRQHGLPLLKWSASLANYAKWYSNQRRKDCALIHSTADYGENIFWGGGKRWTPTNAVSAWVAEEPYYSYAKKTCIGGHECLHYTQLVWKKTTMVGCAKIVCNSGDTFIVCEYYPHGNVIGERPY